MFHGERTEAKFRQFKTNTVWVFENWSHSDRKHSPNPYLLNLQQCWFFFQFWGKVTFSFCFPFERFFSTSLKIACLPLHLSSQCPVLGCRGDSARGDGKTMARQPKDLSSNHYSIPHLGAIIHPTSIWTSVSSFVKWRLYYLLCRVVMTTQQHGTRQSALPMAKC